MEAKRTNVTDRGGQPAGWNAWSSRSGTAQGIVVVSVCAWCSIACGADAPTLDVSKHSTQLDLVSMLFVFMLATIIGMGVIRRVSRLLHTPLMSLTNAISAIAVIGAIIVAGGEEYPTWIRAMGSIALFASMTNIISGFMITDRMLKMFKDTKGGKA